MTATMADLNGHNPNDEKLAAYLRDFDDAPDVIDPGEAGIPNATLHQSRVNLELDRLRAIDEARRIFATERNGDGAPIPDPVALNDFLAQPDVDAAYRIEGLLPTGGRALLAAQYKAGKTTLVGNLVRALADGHAFLGRFQIAASATVAIIDDEVDDRQLRRQLRDQNIINPGAVKVISLRGRVSSFNILDADVRSEWASRLRDVDVLVLDCLRPVLDALGLDESREAGRLLVAFDELLRQADISEAIVVHHMGHSGERSRGDSRLLDWPDVLWKIVRDTREDNPAADRYFSAYGRDVDIREGKLDYTHTNRSLLYIDTNRTESAGRDVIPDIIAVLTTATDGLSGRQLEDALTDRGHPQKVARAGVKLALKDSVIYTTEGPRRARVHHLNPTQCVSASECVTSASTQSE